MAGERDRILCEKEWLARRDFNLQADKVEPGHALGDGMLDLQSRIHLQKEERFTCIEEEFDRPRIHISRRTRRHDRRVAETLAQLRRDGGRGRFLDHLLVPSLDGAFALAERDDGAIRVREDLHLDMARADDEAFEQYAVIAESAMGRAPCRRKAIRKLGRLVDLAHPHATATRDRLDQQRVADTLRFGSERRVRLVIAGVAGDGRHARRLHQPLRARLVTHRADRRSGWPDEDESGIRDGLRESRVLGEEAIAGVNRLRAALFRGVQYGGDIEVTLQRRGWPDAVRLVRHLHMQRRPVRLRIDGDHTNPHRPQRPRDPNGDLSSVGDEDFTEHGDPQIRNLNREGVKDAKRGRECMNRHDLAPLYFVFLHALCAFAVQSVSVVHDGERRSRKARRPSWPSGLVRRWAIREAV